MSPAGQSVTPGTAPKPMRKKKTISPSIQDYLKSIYLIAGDGQVSTTAVSKEMNISGASVTGMLKRLYSLGYVEYKAYKGVRLAAKGKKIALDIIRKHRLLETYLYSHLGLSMEYIHKEACSLEHVVSNEFMDRIVEILDDTQYSPFGKPIPDKNFNMPPCRLKSLLEIGLNKECNLKVIELRDEEILEYLRNKGFIAGVKVSLIAIEPYNGPVSIKVAGKTQVISYEIKAITSSKF